MARELGVMKSVAPGLEWTENLHQQLLAAARTIQWNKEQNLVDGNSWLIYPVLLLKEFSGPRRLEVQKRLGLNGKEQREVESVVQELEKLSWTLQQEDLSASQIYEMLQPLPVVGLLALLAANPGEALLRSRVLLYMEQLADVELSIDGHDLLKLGFEPGPDMGRALKAVRRARLDGEILSRDEELFLAGSMLNGKKGV
jgi:tRNA nucleotidyltransferase (CCA-adding enzyme)